MGINVAIIGASNKPIRYSYKAMRELQKHGHQVFLVSPNHNNIEGLKVYPSTTAIDSPIDTVTMYVSESISRSMAQELIQLAPKRVIFNPGSENRELMNTLESKKIQCEEACTLVMLSIGNF